MNHRQTVAVAEALRAARKITDRLSLGQSPTREEVARLDALLMPALEIVDAPATT